jgi:hypothetical protein
MKKNERRPPPRIPEIVSLNDELFSQRPGIEVLDDLDRRLALALAAAGESFVCDTFTCGSYAGTCGAFACGTFKIKP